MARLVESMCTTLSSDRICSSKHWEHASFCVDFAKFLYSKPMARTAQNKNATILSAQYVGKAKAIFSTARLRLGFHTPEALPRLYLPVCYNLIM